MSIGLVGAVLFVAFAVVFFLLFRRLLSPARDVHADLKWSGGFSVASYRPMERLFLEDDYDFLAAQPGFHPQIYRKLQSERRRVFRGYLRCIRKDFDRLSAVAKMVLLSAPHDSPDLAAALFKQRLTFTYAMAAVEFRLLLQTAGVGTVDVRGLVGALEGMRSQLQSLTAQLDASAA